MARAYIFNAAMYCERCAKLIQSDLDPSTDSEDYPQGPYPDGGGEADSPQHCDRCGLFLENSLTDAGIAYVREAMQRANPLHPSVALLDWASYYGDVLCECSTLPENSDSDTCVACYYRNKTVR